MIILFHFYSFCCFVDVAPDSLSVNSDDDSLSDTSLDHSHLEDSPSENSSLICINSKQHCGEHLQHPIPTRKHQ